MDEQRKRQLKKGLIKVVAEAGEMATPSYTGK